MKRTTATSISAKTRAEVMERDKSRCVVCGATYGLQCAHIFVNRSHGGLGVKENLAMLCVECHTKLDNGLKKDSEPIRIVVQTYVGVKHPNIDIKKLKYQKGEAYE